MIWRENPYIFITPLNMYAVGTDEKASEPFQKPALPWQGIPAGVLLQHPCEDKLPPPTQTPIPTPTSSQFPIQHDVNCQVFVFVSLLVESDLPSVLLNLILSVVTVHCSFI